MAVKLTRLTDADGNILLPFYGLLNGGVKNIRSGDDLNNYIKVGVYCVTGNSDAYGIANMPSARAGRLFVLAGLGDDVAIQASWDYIIQIYIAYNASGIYIRDISTGESFSEITYGPWKSINMTTI